MHVFLIDGPRPGQSMVDRSDFVVKDVRVGLVAINALLEDRLIIDVQRQAGLIISTRSLEAARLNLKDIVSAVAVFVDPPADRVAREGRLEMLGPVASVREDATIVVMPTDQDVGGIWGHDEFHWPKSHHHVRHPGCAAQGGGEIAETALGLIRNARRQDRLILRRERRLLSKSPGLGLIMRRLRWKPEDRKSTRLNSSHQ